MGSFGAEGKNPRLKPVSWNACFQRPEGRCSLRPTIAWSHCMEQEARMGWCACARKKAQVRPLHGAIASSGGSRGARMGSFGGRESARG